MSTQKTWEFEGKIYEDSGERSVEGAIGKKGTIFTSSEESEVVGKLDSDAPWYRSFIILREVAKPEPKMCPAGCGRKHGAINHGGPALCPWAQAYMDAPMEGDEPAWSAYADAHWREFQTEPATIDEEEILRRMAAKKAEGYAIGVDVAGPDVTKPVQTKPAFQVGKTYRDGNGRCHKLTETKSPVLRLVYPLECSRSERSWTAEGKHIRGTPISVDDLLPGAIEDEKKAEAAGTEAACRKEALPPQRGGCTQHADTQTPATPAPQPTKDPEAFYRWMWGFPPPFEVGVEKEKPPEKCACCGGDGQAQILLSSTAISAVRKIVPCPECGGSGVHG